MVGGIGGEQRRGRATNRLTDRSIKAFIKPSSGNPDGKKKLSDGGGLYLTRTPAGTPVWRLKYRLDGRERLYSIGPYPDVTLEQARRERDLAKAQLRDGRDPVRARDLRRAEAATASEDTFGAIASEWIAQRRRDWSDVHALKSQRALERDVFPALGKLPVAEITPAMVAIVVEKVMDRGVRDTASKLLQHIASIFRFAQAKGRCRDNPAEPVKELLPRRGQTAPRPALLDVAELRDVLRRADVAPISPAVRLAQRLCAFTAARIGNVVEAQWSELDIEAAPPSWTIPRSKMKARDRQHDHTVLLGGTIADELRTWKERTGGSGYVFPSPAGNDHITRESLEKAYRVTLGLAKKHTLHGWRAAFATLARDAGFSRDVVELALDHVHDTEVARAYDRGERMDERLRLMRWWDAVLRGDSRSAAEIVNKL